MAGDYAQALEVCRAYCDDVGYCVTVTPTAYVYRDGQEAGVIVGLINYPRFPSELVHIEAKAVDLAMRLRDALGQESFSVQTPTITTWFSWRAEDNGAAPNIQRGEVPMTHRVDDALVEKVARAIEAARCKGREGPFGGYDYGHNPEFYGPAPDRGRYVIRDFRDLSSPDYGKWLHQTNDRAEHEALFEKMTREHYARAALEAAGVAELREALELFASTAVITPETHRVSSDEWVLSKARAVLANQGKAQADG